MDTLYLARVAFRAYTITAIGTSETDARDTIRRDLANRVSDGTMDPATADDLNLEVGVDELHLGEASWL